MNISAARLKLQEALALLADDLPTAVTVNVPVEGAQQVIDAAPVGATLVLGGTYPALTLNGSGKVLTGADGTSVQHLDIRGNGWTVRQLQVTGAPNLSESIWCDPSAAHITLDHLVVRSNGARRGVAANCTDLVVTNCDIRGFAAPGVEGQAIGGWMSAGPFRIEDNYLEAAGENLMFGGGDSINGIIPSDIIIRRNTLNKPEEWRARSLSVKNILELKNARRVLIEDNTLSGSWTDGQVGFGILLTIRNQNGGAPWTTVEDVTIRNNRMDRVGGGVQILAQDTNYPSGRMRNILIDGNHFDVSPRPGDIGRTFEISNGPVNLTISNNVITSSGGLASAFAFGIPAQRCEGLVVTGNTLMEGSYGIWGQDAPGLGTAVLDMYAPGYVWSNNVVHPGGERTIHYPDGTTVQ